MSIRVSVGQEVPASGRVRIDILAPSVGGRLESIQSPNDPKSDAVLNVDYKIHGDEAKELEWLSAPRPTYIILRVAVDAAPASRFQQLGPSAMVLLGVALSSVLTYCQTTRSSDVKVVERAQADVDKLAASIRDRGTCTAADTAVDCIRLEIRRMATAEEQLSSLRVYRTETRMADSERNRIKLRFVDANMCDGSFSNADCFRGISDVTITWMRKNCPDLRIECVRKVMTDYTPRLQTLAPPPPDPAAKLPAQITSPSPQTDARDPRDSQTPPNSRNAAIQLINSRNSSASAGSAQ